jgi:ribosomal protein L11 methyltransferase
MAQNNSGGFTPVPDCWFVLSIPYSSVLEAEKYSAVMFDFGATAVEETDCNLKTYLAPPENVADCLKSIRMALNKVSETGEVVLDYSWQRHEDWSHFWRRGFSAKKISEKLVVKPSWCATEDQENVVTVVIDPGMAFGTAEHATTRGSLRLLEKAMSPGEKIMDVGCGSGILSIVAMKFGANQVLGVDSDPYAVETTLANLHRNEITDNVSVQMRKVSRSWLENNGEWEGIVANIQSDVLLSLISGFRNALVGQGWLILSGIMVDEWACILSCAENADFTLRDVDTEKGWISAWFESNI